VVAESPERVIGFGSLWTEMLHPHALYVAVGLVPEWHGRGLGSRLMGGLLRLRGPVSHLPLLTAIWETNDRGARFLARYGFVPVRQTWEPVLPVASGSPAESSRFRSLHAAEAARCKRAGYSIASLAQLSDDPEWNFRVAVLCGEIYAATHTMNPSADISPDAWRDLIFGNPDDAPVEEGSFVATRGAELAAAALLHPGAEPAVLELGYRGVGKEHGPWSRSLVLALTLAQVLYAMQRGCDLRAEVDSTNPWAMLMYEALPFRPSPAWVTWRRPPDP
jgi:N-acetylglutamate synthase-like GNAT family acetyltransferase